MKVANFSLGDKYFAQRIVSPDENVARQSFARQCNEIMPNAMLDCNAVEILKLHEKSETNLSCMSYSWKDRCKCLQCLNVSKFDIVMPLMHAI